MEREIYDFNIYFKSLVALLNDSDENDSSIGAVASDFMHSTETQSRHYDLNKSMRTSLKVSSKIKLTQTATASTASSSKAKKQINYTSSSAADTESHEAEVSSEGDIEYMAPSSEDIFCPFPVAVEAEIPTVSMDGACCSNMFVHEHAEDLTDTESHPDVEMSRTQIPEIIQIIHIVYLKTRQFNQNRPQMFVMKSSS